MYVDCLWYHWYEYTRSPFIRGPPRFRDVAALYFIRLPTAPRQWTSSSSGSSDTSAAAVRCARARYPLTSSLPLALEHLSFSIELTTAA